MAQNRKPRPSVSRTPASAPRRVAGRTPRPTETPPEVETPRDGGTPHEEEVRGDAPTQTTGADPTQAEETQADETQAEETQADETQADETDSEPTPSEEASGRAASDAGLLTRSGTTRVLAGLLTLLLVIGLAELAYLFVFTGEDDTRATADEPVKIQMSEWRTASEKSAKAVTEVLNVSWKDYDQNLQDARKLMTDDFADEYSATTKDSKKRFVETKADYDFAVVGRSVVRAAQGEVTSLLFLNQFVYKGEGKQRTGPEIYQVRVEVTAERSGDKWLISDLRAL